MSFDKMARELLMPVYDRLQNLERDAAAMQKLVAQLVLGEKKAEPEFTRDELLTISQYVLDCAAHSSGQRRHELLLVEKKVRFLLAR